MSGEQIDGERWLLYRLAELWRLGQAGDLARSAVLRRSTAAVHDYLAALFLRHLPPATGPLCAIDLDGVLECDQLGFSATSPTGALALRALIAHGYRPVLATGRSVPEVRDRCLAFGLAGGVAEYGSAIYCGGEPVDLRPPQSAALLDLIRKELSGRSGVEVDPDYRYAVRARSDSGPLPTELIRQIPALSDPDVRIVHGDGQTDVTVAGIDKGTGLAALAALLSDPGCAFAIGDSLPDIPLLACAALARAPRNARFGSAGPAFSGRGVPIRRASPRPAPTCSATVPAAACSAGPQRLRLARRPCWPSSTSERMAWPPSRLARPQSEHSPLRDLDVPIPGRQPRQAAPVLQISLVTSSSTGVILRRDHSALLA